jgi:glucosamine 6-phosphate synthetase-like amidotransferase/phosphosugar isomerase protein
LFSKKEENMLLKTFAATLFLLSLIFISDRVSHADELVFKEINKNIDIMPTGIRKCTANKELTKEHLRELEKDMKLNVDNALFPKWFYEINV